MNQDNQKKNADANLPLHHLVLLRGLAREARHWGEFLNELEVEYKKQGLRVRVSTIDFPGCGRHSEMTPFPSIQSMTDFAREKFIGIVSNEVEAQLERPVVRRLIAISLGGMVAADWLDRYPTDFQSAILINSSLRGLSPVFERLRYEALPRLPGLLRSQTVEEKETKILAWVSNRQDRREAVLKSWALIQATRPVHPLTIPFQLTAAGRFTAPERISVPLLVLASRQDRMVNPSCSEAIASKYGARILFHPTAGHELALDAGPWAALMIAEWQTN